MIASIEDGSRTSEHAVHREGQARRDGLHPASELVLSLRFDDEMSVVALQRVVKNPKRAPLAAHSQSALKLPHEIS